MRRAGDVWRVYERSAGNMRFWVISPNGVTVAHFRTLSEAGGYAKWSAGELGETNSVPVIDRTGRQVATV